MYWLSKKRTNNNKKMLLEIMNDDKKSIAASNRNAAACITDGYKLFFECLKKLIKMTWLQALPFALVCSVLGTMLVMHSSTVLLTVIFIIIGGVFEILFYLKALKIMATHDKGYDVNVMKKLKSINGKTTWNAVKAAFSNIGLILVVLLTCGVIALITGLIVLLPCGIVATANYNAHLGELYGDPLGMPDYVTVITAIAVFIAGYIQLYIRTSVLSALYYVYVTIETREEGKRKFLEKTH